MRILQPTPCRHHVPTRLLIGLRSLSAQNGWPVLTVEGLEEREQAECHPTELQRYFRGREHHPCEVTVVIDRSIQPSRENLDASGAGHVDGEPARLDYADEPSEKWERIGSHGLGEPGMTPVVLIV